MSASGSVAASDVARDRRFMGLALALGRRGLGRTWPNPAVGAVIVKDGEIVGRGWTQPGGRPHAEIEALQRAGELARGATLYVTLEPCSHHGKSPPCADAVIASGIARVASAMEDPNPEVAGRGHARLRSAICTERKSLSRSKGTRRPLRLITINSRNCTRSKVVKRKLQLKQTRRRRMTDESSVGRESFTWVSRLAQLGQRIPYPS